MSTYTMTESACPLGYGYAMVVRDGEGNWVLKTTLDTDLAFIGIWLSDDASNALNDIIRALNNGNQPEAIQLIRTQLAPAVPAITEANGRTLFDVESERALAGVRAGLQNNALYNSLVDTREMLALASLAYNGPGTIGPGLRAALNSPDPARGRAEAWFQIRCQTNPPPRPGERDVRNGIARRRYVESQVFGLYDAGGVTANAARAVYQMYTAHRDVILDYEQARSANVASANTINFTQIDVIDRSARQEPEEAAMDRPFSEAPDFDSLGAEIRPIEIPASEAASLQTQTAPPEPEPLARAVARDWRWMDERQNLGEEWEYQGIAARSAFNASLSLVTRQRLQMIEAMASFDAEGSAELDLQPRRRVDARALELLTSVAELRG